MKTVLFIALMFGFLIGNAQQDRQHSRAYNSNEQAQIYTGINPGYPSEVNLYKNQIRKTDNHPGYPVTGDPYMHEIGKPDNDAGYTFVSYPYQYEIRIPDNNAGYPSAKYPYLNKIAKTN